MKKLKKSEFIKYSDNPELNHSVIKMIKHKWSDIVNNPELISEKEFTDTELESLAVMNLKVFTEKALSTGDYFLGLEEPIEYVSSFILADVKKELKSLIRV